MSSYSFPKWLRMLQAFVFFINAFNICLQLNADAPKIGYIICAVLQMLAFGLFSGLNIAARFDRGID